jgi:hypothetical protein
MLLPRTVALMSAVAVMKHFYASLQKEQKRELGISILINSAVVTLRHATVGDNVIC